MTSFSLILGRARRSLTSSVIKLRDAVATPSDEDLKQRMVTLQSQFERHIERKNRLANAHESLIDKLTSEIETIDDELVEFEAIADVLKRLIEDA